MFTRIFWEKTLERFLRGFATAFLLTTSGLEAISDGTQFGWKERALAGLLQGVGAIALSIAGGQVGDKTSPSLLTSPPELPLDDRGNLEYRDGGHANNTSLILGMVVGVVVLLLVLLLVGRL